jgi:mannose-1-phosphate guanylyltransferase
LDLRAMMAFHERKGGLGALHLIRVEDPSAFGCVVNDAENRISAFVEKPPKGTEPTNEINAGTYLLERKVLDMIPAGRNVSIERETFPGLLDARGQLYALGTDAYWLDIGTPDKYRAAHADVMSGALGDPPVAGAEERQPGVWVQPGAVIDASTRLVPPVLIGRDTAVGPGAYVAATSVGDRCTVGYGVRVEGSVLLDGASVERAAGVVDCVLGPEAVVAEAAQVRGEIVVAAQSSPSTMGRSV